MNDMKKFFKSFVYAFRGVLFCIANEQNMRVHICFTAYMFGFLKIYDFFEVSRAEFAVLFALCGLVMSLEAVNTAVERAVDLSAGGRQSELAKVAKDAAAGAVLISAIASVAAGISIMFQPEAFVKMFEYYKENPAVFVLLAVSICVSVAFVFLPGYLKKKKEKTDGKI